MSRSIPAKVRPELLVWARESAHLSLEQAATKLKVESATLEAWEKGDAAVTIAQVRKLGEVYKRPLAIFFLPEPPVRFDAQREFRRFAGSSPEQLSPELMLAIRNASYQREHAVELQQLLGEQPLPIDQELHPGIDHETGGRLLRESLGLTWEAQLQWPNPHAALNAWRSAVEAQGTLVFQASGISLDEMRGTCIPDHPFPTILLNSKDAPHGRIFSLIHEYAHVLLHAAGHATTLMVGQRSPEEQPLEVAANGFAAAALLPSEAFLEIADQYPHAAEGEDRALRLLSQKVKVSPEAVLRRLVTLQRARESVYRSKRREWGNRLWYVRAQAGGAIPQPVKIMACDGRRFTHMVLEAYDRRLISTSAASDYLGAKPKYFDRLRQDLSFGGTRLMA